MSIFTRLRAYLVYFFRAQNAHGVHSPFVFEFYQQVWKQSAQVPLDPNIEHLRREALLNQTWLEVVDLGAGSEKTPGIYRKVADIAKYSSKSTVWVQFLVKLIHHYSYKSVLDLGSSLGLTTSYLAKSAQVVSVEGCPTIGKIAQEHWDKLGLPIDFHVGNLDDILPSILQANKPFDLILLDANHRFEPTKRYVEALLNALPPWGCLVIDDIHWSKEMEQAWSDSIQDPKVTVSIDLFEMGLLFVRPEQSKQHFILR